MFGFNPVNSSFHNSCPNTVEVPQFVRNSKHFSVVGTKKISALAVVVVKAED